MVNEYSIRDLEVLTGIKSHTIRIWEQRYGLLTPKRTETNIRFYFDEDLRFLLQVALLNDNGYRISKITKLSKAEINQIYEDLLIAKPEPIAQINGLVSAMVDMNEVQFSKIYEENISKLGIKDTIIQVIYPFLNRIGLLWVTNKIKPIQEHFILNLVRQKIVAAINKLPTVQDSSKSCLLFLPEKEHHEIGLLLAQFILKQARFQVYYAGANVPLDNLSIVNTKLKLNFALTLFTIFPSRNKLQNYVEALGDSFKNTQVYISGYQSRFIGKVPENVKVWKGVDELLKLVDSAPHSPHLERGINPTSGASND